MCCLQEDSSNLLQLGGALWTILDAQKWTYLRVLKPFYSLNKTSMERHISALHNTDLSDNHSYPTVEQTPSGGRDRKVVIVLP